MLEKLKQELARGSRFIQFGFLKAFGQGLGMIAPLVIAKFFSPELFGSYSLAKMVIFFFLTLLIVSTQTPFIVFANQERAESGRINKTFSAECVFVGFGLLFFLMVVLLFGRYITRFANIGYVELFCVFLAFLGLGLKCLLCVLFLGMGQQLKNSLVEFVFGFLSLALVVVLYLTDALNIRTIFLTYLFSGVVVVGVFGKFVDFNLLFPLSFEKDHLRKMFDFTKWVFLGATAIYFVNWGDNLVLRYFVSMKDIGTYNLAYQVFKGVATLTFMVIAYFLPFVSEHIKDSDKMRNYLFNKRPRIFMLGFLAIGFIFVIIPYLFKIIYGQVYAESISILRILLIGTVVILYTNFYDPVLHALKKYKFTQTTWVGQVFLHLFLDVVLVPLMGVYGAAVAAVVAYSCRAVAIEIYFRLKLKSLIGM